VADPSTTSVIVPAFNEGAAIGVVVAALKAGAPWHEVIVVDDGSSDSTPEPLAAYADRIRAVRHDQNSGFAGACNDGAAAASGEWLVFLNNDTIPQPGWLDALLH
jgi:glycosyltransferase involved in cell wall biosynthesis